MKDEREVTYTKLQDTQCMNNKGESTFCIANSDKACISTELADLIYEKVETNWVFRIETIQQELCKPKRNKWN